MGGTHQPQGPAELVLVDWVWARWSAGRWFDVVDPHLEGEYDRQEAEVAIKVGLWCSHPSTVARKGMKEEVRYLDGSDLAKVPPLPDLTEGYDAGKGAFELDDFLHSYASSSFDKLSTISTTFGKEASATGSSRKELKETEK